MDPRFAPPEVRAKSANLSPLMQAKAKANQGEVVNFCPFGCEDQELDEHGYCRHLVGFTNDGKTMEPLLQVGMRQIVQGATPKPVLKSDKLERITTSSRVYRDVDAKEKVTT